MKFYCEYICEDKNYKRVVKIPEAVVFAWLRESETFKNKRLTYYMIGEAAENENSPIRWMNKGAICVDEEEDIWLYKHDFSYWVVRRC